MLLVNHTNQAQTVTPNADIKQLSIPTTGSKSQIATSSNLAREAEQLLITQIAEGVYQHSSYLNVPNFGMVDANGLVVVQNKLAYIIDTPWTDKDTAKLLDWINQQGFTAVASVSTHSHQDRAGGIGYLNRQGINTIVSETTQQILAKAHKPQAQKIFKDKRYIMQTDLIEVYDMGAGHTQDNLVVWLPKQQILFGGCLIKSLNSTSMGYIAEADMQAWPLTVKKVIQQFPHINQVIPGHGALGDSTLLNHTINLIEKYNSQQLQ
ncbi:beta-lactamase [Shewanella aestuarii]|nr:beta-lactamase [Shewanella aestuarii]